MVKKIIIPFGENWIVAKLYNNGPVPEIVIEIEDKDGNYLQDVCLVRQQETNNEWLDCLVWGDERDENFSHKFKIRLYEED